MDVLIACDKFKGTLDAVRVCEAIARGLKSAHPSLVVETLPLADGGDGTLDVLKTVGGYQAVQAQTIDPLGREISAEYLSRGSVAFIELAAASGIARLKPAELDILGATTIGTGLLIKDAIGRGHTSIVLALGGSCTNDVGTGIAHGLGFKFYDADDAQLIPSGGKIGQITRVEVPPTLPKLKILCDVPNPLYGPNGAARIYGPQKGASPNQITELDIAMEKFSELVLRDFGRDIASFPGGGAAGGIAAGLYGLISEVEIEPGFEFIAEQTHLAEKVAAASLIITGEGKLDAQSLAGKVIGGLRAMADTTPITAVVGACDLSEQDKAANFKEVHQIINLADSLEDAMKNTAHYLEQIGSRLKLN